MVENENDAGQPVAAPLAADPVLARLQDAQAQYMNALQDVWTVLLKRYNEAAECHLKAHRDLLTNATGVGAATGSCVTPQRPK
jgi:hypothetical protein